MCGIEDRVLKSTALGKCQGLRDFGFDLSNDTLQTAHAQHPGDRGLDRAVRLAGDCRNVDRVGVRVNTRGGKLTNPATRGLKGAHLRFCGYTLGEDRAELIGVSEQHGADGRGDEQDSRKFH